MALRLQANLLLLRRRLHVPVSLALQESFDTVPLESPQIPDMGDAVHALEEFELVAVDKLTAHPASLALQVQAGACPLQDCMDYRQIS